MSTPQDTSERLLDAAEKLFARFGLDSASLRQITGEAGANLAAVNYHFGSKQKLVRAVIERRLRPINELRLARLDALEAAGEPLELRDVVESFIEPALSVGLHDGREFFVFIARAHGNPSPELREIVHNEMQPIAQRYGAALGKCLPELTLEQLFWRVHFVIGALCHTVINSELLEEVTEGLCRADDRDKMLQRLVDFSVAGFSGPVVGEV
ncbi:MAG: TetR family transcriptional regulator [Planctomycetota bacterium]|nr:MAG: TetR family transcriptional regulator [Planctomycetota bacterium]